MEAVSSVIKKIKKVVEILDPFIKGIQFFLEGIATAIGSVMNVFKGFDLEKDKKSVEESVEKANNNIFRLSSDFNTATKEFVEDLGITGGSGGSGNFTGFSNTIQVGVPATDYGQYQLEDGASVTLNSTTTVAEALDILNETILNIRNQTYVRDAKFTYSVTSDISGHAGHLHSPVTISFTDTGDYTLASPQHTWTFSTSSGDQTSSSTNPTFTWDESAGGTFTIKHRVEAGGAGVQYPGSAGSWSEHTESITCLLYTSPSPRD